LTPEPDYRTCDALHLSKATMYLLLIEEVKILIKENEGSQAQNNEYKSLPAQETYPQKMTHIYIGPSSVRL